MPEDRRGQHRHQPIDQHQRRRADRNDGADRDTGAHRDRCRGNRNCEWIVGDSVAEPSPKQADQRNIDGGAADDGVRGELKLFALQDQYGRDDVERDDQRCGDQRVVRSRLVMQRSRKQHASYGDQQVRNTKDQRCVLKADDSPVAQRLLVHCIGTSDVEPQSVTDRRPRAKLVALDRCAKTRPAHAYSPAAYAARN